MYYNQNDHLSIDRISVLMENCCAAKPNWNRVASVSLSSPTAYKYVKDRFDVEDDIQPSIKEWGEVIGEALAAKYLNPNTYQKDDDGYALLKLRVLNNHGDINKVRVEVYAIMRDEATKALCRFKFEVEPSMYNYSNFVELQRQYFRQTGPIK